MGGDVVFSGVAGPPVTIRISGLVQGGTGGDGGLGAANGSAIAFGGNGTRGGTVRFMNCSVQALGMVLEGSGGKGGNATATGIKGADGRRRGRPGTDAVARGGNGGAIGDTPSPPLAPGVLPPDIDNPPLFGSGGNATAIPGNGGNAADPAGDGGPSGTGSALGGSKGPQGPGPDRPVETPEVGPTGPTGGTGLPAVQPGVP
jgi:hypothetical protein